MACFLVSAAEAVMVSVIKKIAEKKEKQAGVSYEQIQSGHSGETGVTLETDNTLVNVHPHGITWSVKLKWLTYMLWGGAVLLAFEHIWHGEVVPWFPFLTAMYDSSSAAEMFHEMATVGVCMALLITTVWFVMCKVSDVIVKRPSEAKESIDHVE